MIDELRRNGMDEKAVRAIARAVAAQEAAKIVERRIAELRNEIEEKLSKLGLDAEAIRRVIDEVQSRLLSELDRRFMHVLDAINEVGNMNRDVLDLVSEILRHESTFEEELGKLRSALDEERLEEIFYRMLVKRGILKKRRKWVLPIIGLCILGAVVASFVINPAITAVIILIIIAVLLRW